MSTSDGHGHWADKSGMWVMSPYDDAVYYEKVMRIWAESGRMEHSKLTIIMDSCHSGSWAVALEHHGEVFYTRDRGASLFQVQL